VLHVPAGRKAAQIVLALCCFAFPMLLVPLALREGEMERWVRVGLSRKAVKKVVIAERLAPLQYALVASGGVYRSTDRGVTWIAANRGLPSDEWGRIRVQAIAADAARPSIVYAGMGGVGREEDELSAGLYVSDDSGATWFGLGRDMAGKEVQAIATAYVPANTGSMVCIATVGEIHCSVDEAQSWRRLDWRGGGVRISSLAIHPNDPDVIYVGTEGDGFYGTEDGGGSWVALNQGLDDLDVRDIAVSATAPNVMYLATGGGVYKSTDAGTTWQELTGPIRDWCANTVIVHPWDENTLFAGLRHHSVYYSMDGGMYWVPLKRGLGELTVGSLAIDPQDTAVLWAGTANGVWRYVFELPAWSMPTVVSATVPATPELASTQTVLLRPSATVSPTAAPPPSRTPVSTLTPSPTLTDTPEPTAIRIARATPTATLTPSLTMTTAPTAAVPPKPKPPTPTSEPPTPTPGRP